MSVMQGDIDDLRKRINTLDEQMLRLLNERAELALHIGKLKSVAGSEVYDPSRERAILERLDTLNAGPLDKGAIEEIFACIITACRELQMR
jgi:chorismate mutase-like protein